MKNTRTCIVCRNKFQKIKLNRIVKTVNGEICFDKNQIAQTRGCYLCFNSACIEKLEKSRALNRVFKKNISDETYNIILSEINKEAK